MALSLHVFMVSSSARASAKPRANSLWWYLFIVNGYIYNTTCPFIYILSTADSAQELALGGCDEDCVAGNAEGICCLAP